MAASVNLEEFKEAMRRWPTGVAVITTKFKGRLYGLTVNSFTSASLNPPLILFCLNKQCGSFEAFKGTDKFIVNILSENQQHIAKNFATKLLDKFANVKYYEDKGGAGTFIEGANCVLECAKLYEYSGGDHVIIVAKVERSSIKNSLKSLIYFEREYKTVK